jgi:Subunit 11 of the general transcription factor TFIIH
MTHEWYASAASLQIPYLISLAGLVNSYLPDYPFSPHSTFRLLKKLDSIFASLLLGEDTETGGPISGFDSRRQVISMTEKVRIKSIAEMGRVALVEARDRDDGGFIEGNDSMDLDTTSADDDDDDDLAEVLAAEVYGASAGQWEMEVARIYAKTIQLLGDEFGKSGLIS